MDKNQAEQILKTLVLDPNSQFRSGQWEAIDALVNRNASVLVVQRTGWGKSSVYFTATKILRDQGKGLTLIVSPLLALMRNQIDMANKGNLNVVTINSANTKEWGHCKQEILSDSVDALLVSPERLANEDFVTTTLRPIANHIGLIVIDEAHCISDWGHDFRPDYRRIMNLLVSLPPNVPVLGTTATANQRVIDDIQSQLGDIEIQRGPLMRESIALQNLRLPKPADRQAWLLKHIDELPGTGIIYALTKRDAETVATFLSDHGVDARAYFSDVKNPRYRNSDEYRKHLESLLFNNEIKALVATSALGMGYDKPDLGFVIHYQAPSSIISYYQQVGRAGRGIEHAVGVLMTGAEDTNIQEYFRTSSFPPEEFVSTILNVLSASDGMNIREIEAQINLSYTQINTVLKYLSVETPSPVLQDGARWRRTAVDYSLNHSKIRFLTQQRVQEWEEIQAYVDERGCLMEFLANSLDDKNPTACGKCAPCRGEPVVSSSFSREDSVRADDLMKRADATFQCAKQLPKDVFKTYKFSKNTNLPTDLRAETGRVLSTWNDSGWGHMVKKGKLDGHFAFDLVEATAEMILDRWCPEPEPTWITSVPSTRNKDLVRSFAERLADLLDLPFVEVVDKIRDHAPQREQKNRAYRAKNLDGVFAINDILPEDPVFLIDDIVDSRWTLTVIAALMRQSGSGPVFPFALTDAASGN